MSRRPPRFAPLLLLALLLLAAASLRCAGPGPGPETTGPEGEAAGRSYFFCFWNVENLYDDEVNPKERGADKEFDTWFAEDAGTRKLKYDHISKALAELNDGKGPDILAVAEVESQRAAELLRDALNHRQRDKALHYDTVVYKDPHGMKNIATAILTRVPVDESKTKVLGRRQRILEGHVEVNGHDLVVIASHWSSRISAKEGEGRDHYANAIYGRYKALWKANPDVDFLVCGDFNDTPEDEAVAKHLHAVGDRQAVLRTTDEPLLLNLFAGKDPEQFGTHYYQRKWYIFDQIVVSPGLLDDKGWTCETETVRTVNTLHQPNDRQRRPWRFGPESNKAPRGYSDHFPVTVRLRVRD
jgi:endonuclease/exonuclease/phosphatase family metal-dependent hydrolase